MAAPQVAAAAVKAITTIASDEKGRKVLVFVFLMLIAMFVVPILIFSSLLEVAAEIDYSSLMAPEGEAGAGVSHEYIGRLVSEDDTEYEPGPFSPPLHIDGYKSLISSGFGWRTDPFSGESAFHAGLDFGCAVGTSVYPVKPGKVIITERSSSGYGNYIVISHGGGYASLYGHLDSIYVSVGQVVSTNTVIGLSGNSGKSTGPHLHLEIIKDGTPQNPRWYMP